MEADYSFISKEKMQEWRDRVLRKLSTHIGNHTMTGYNVPAPVDKIEPSCQEIARMKAANEERCICAIQQLMSVGCKCGAIKREREARERKQGE